MYSKNSASFASVFIFFKAGKKQYREGTEKQLDVILGEIVFCVWICLYSLERKTSQGFDGQTNQEVTNCASTRIEIESGMLMLFCFLFVFSPRTVISIFFIGICTETSDFEAV